MTILSQLAKSTLHTTLCARTCTVTTVQVLYNRIYIARFYVRETFSLNTSSNLYTFPYTYIVHVFAGSLLPNTKNAAATVSWQPEPHSNTAVGQREPDPATRARGSVCSACTHVCYCIYILPARSLSLSNSWLGISFCVACARNFPG